MFKSIQSKLYLVRAHVCTLAVAMSLHAWLWVPQGGARYGGAAYGLALTVAGAAVAAPCALLQLALGQLCRQGVVGMWRAVPFFTGVGYLRLLITSLSSVYTMIYLELITSNFIYTLSHVVLFDECAELEVSEDAFNASITNSSVLNCYTPNLPTLVEEDEPGYYTAIALLMTSFWIALPFVLYNPVKHMRRILYVLGPLVVLVVSVGAGGAGSWSQLRALHSAGDWGSLAGPGLYHAALTQALASTQVAGGFLVSAGDALYANTDVQWTTLIVIATNVLASWLGLLFWFALGGSNEEDTSFLAVMQQLNYPVEEKTHLTPWLLLIYFALILSGTITLITAIYPLYERFRLLGGSRWRVLAAVSSVLGAAAALGLLAGRESVLPLLEHVALPLLITIASVVETSAFVFIYGWKVLIEDVEFLSGKRLSKYWVCGWCCAPVVLTSAGAWRVAAVWREGGGGGVGGAGGARVADIAAAAGALAVLVAGAVVVVGKQHQYDLWAKLKSSFAPSRHWGPRDPIAHYYWAGRRAGGAGGVVVRGGPAPPPAPPHPRAPPHHRHSDDCLYTIYRRQLLTEDPRETKLRSKSLDCEPK